MARGDYQIEVIEGRHSELVTPDEPDGVRLDIPARSTLWGRMEFRLYVAARPDRRRRVGVVGAGGVTILDDITEVEEFDHAPWSTDQLSGLVAFEAWQQSAGRRAVLRDRDAFPMFVDAVRSIEPAVARTLERVAREVEADVTVHLSETVRKIFGRVLNELDDLDNPMRTAIGTHPARERCWNQRHRAEELGTEVSTLGSRPEPTPEAPSIDDLVAPPPMRSRRIGRPVPGRPCDDRGISLPCSPTLLPTAYAAVSTPMRASCTTTTDTLTTCC